MTHGKGKSDGRRRLSSPFQGRGHERRPGRCPPGAGAADPHRRHARRRTVAVCGGAGGAGGAGQLSAATTPASTTPMRGRSPICWGRWARPPPICCCRLSASRRFALSRRLLVWGVRALTGKSLRYAMWRLVAWPLGTMIVAAGLGVLPAPASLAGRRGRLDRHRRRRSCRPCRRRVSARPRWPGCCRCSCWRWACRWPSWPRACASCRIAARPVAIFRPRMVWLGGLFKMPNFRKTAAPVCHDDDDEDDYDI